MNGKLCSVSQNMIYADFALKDLGQKLEVQFQSNMNVGNLVKNVFCLNFYFSFFCNSSKTTFNFTAGS